MMGQGRYVPPPYMPLGQSDQESEVLVPSDVQIAASQSDGVVQWSSGICACCDDITSCFFMSCYACNYRKTLRSKYNLQEAPCGDFVTHFFCHPCAICQEYREICERSSDVNFAGLQVPAVTAPPLQKMESASGE